MNPRRTLEARSGAALAGAPRLALAMLATLLGPTAASAVTVSRGPYLQRGTPTSVVVRWRTGTATDSRVVWGPQYVPTLPYTVSNATSTTEHELTLTGLQPAKRYWYAIGSTTTLLAGDSSYTFVTPPPVGTV